MLLLGAQHTTGSYKPGIHPTTLMRLPCGCLGITCALAFHYNLNSRIYIIALVCCAVRCCACAFVGQVNLRRSRRSDARRLKHRQSSKGEERKREREREDECCAQLVHFEVAPLHFVRHNVVCMYVICEFCGYIRHKIAECTVQRSSMTVHSNDWRQILSCADFHFGLFRDGKSIRSNFVSPESFS